MQEAEPDRPWKLPLCRSYLYVPTTKLELLPKALASEADAVILDLEDGVPVERKPEGRKNLNELVAIPHDKPLFVRVNPLQTEFAAADLEISVEQVWFGYKALHDRLDEMAAPVEAFRFTKDERRLLGIALVSAAGALRDGASVFPRERTMRLATRIIAATIDDGERE